MTDLLSHPFVPASPVRFSLAVPIDEKLASCFNQTVHKHRILFKLSSEDRLHDVETLILPSGRRNNVGMVLASTEPTS